MNNPGQGVLDSQRLVRRSAVRHGKPLQDLQESFKDQSHLHAIVGEAQLMVSSALAGG
jgi:hypothetical protein